MIRLKTFLAPSKGVFVRFLLVILGTLLAAFIIVEINGSASNVGLGSLSDWRVNLINAGLGSFFLLLLYSAGLTRLAIAFLGFNIPLECNIVFCAPKSIWSLLVLVGIPLFVYYVVACALRNVLRKLLWKVIGCLFFLAIASFFISVYLHKSSADKIAAERRAMLSSQGVDHDCLKSLPDDFVSGKILVYFREDATSEDFRVFATEVSRLGYPFFLPSDFKNTRDFNSELGVLYLYADGGRTDADGGKTEKEWVCAIRHLKLPGVATVGLDIYVYPTID